MGFLLFSSSFINAQSFNLHLDKTFYIAGESIHYCIYPATTLKTDSMLIYVEMHSYSGQMKMQQIHRLQSKSVAGSISLPVSWNEGNYLFVCYAIWDDVLGDTSVVRSYQEIIPVYNDLELKPSDEGIDSIRYSTEIAPMNQVTSFPTKSKASLSLNVYNSDLPTQNGEYSVSIHQATIGENKQLSESNTVAAVPDPLRYSVRKQLVLSGKVRSEERRVGKECA